MIKRSVAYYLNRIKDIRVLESVKIKRIALLSNFTLQGLSDILKVMANEQNMNIEVYESPYNQFRQEILNKESGWRKFNADLTFLLLDFDSLIGDIKFKFYSLDDSQRNDLIKETTDQLKSIIKMALENQYGKIVISNFVLPTYSPFGIYDSKMKYSLRAFVNILNSKIQDLVLQNNSLYSIEMDTFFVKHGKSNITDEKLRYFADMKVKPSFLPELADNMMCFLKPLFGRTRKCLVLDLDNTLWGGIIGEDGIGGIKLDNKPPGNAYLEFQKVILELYDRGIILAINSKNNIEEVKEVFNNHPQMILKEYHFAALYINWQDKATNLINIATDLNIGMDSMVYFDDDPVNRELVHQKLPEILVVDVPKDPSLYAESLRELNEFNSFQITKEDLEKGKMYSAQLERKSAASQFSDLDEFLQSLEMEIVPQIGNEFTLPRISQLTIKTNQFNLTTRRYSEEQIRAMLNNPNFLIKTFTVRDKFGDNGLTGLYIIKKENKKWFIDTFLMSCRIMGRNVEKTIIEDIVNEAKSSNIEEIIGEYVPTKKNEMIKNFYSEFGFLKINDNLFSLKNITKFNINQTPFYKKRADIRNIIK